MTGLKIKKIKEKEKKRVSQALLPEGESVPGGTGNASTELQAELELGKKWFSCSVNNSKSSKMFSWSIRA